MSYDNPWTYNGDIFDEDGVGDSIGFVYMITDLVNNKRYIGKKIFRNKVSKPPLKGKKKRRISSVQSNWKEYYGSSPVLQILVEQNEKHLYKREILYLCRSKSEMSYLETKLLFKYDALLNDGWYNDWITCKITRKQLSAIRTSQVR